MHHNSQVYGCGGFPPAQNQAKVYNYTATRQESSQADIVSMSSFVPSMHVASQAQPLKMTEKVSTSSHIAAMTDPGQLAAESWRGAAADTEIQQQNQ